MVSETADFGIVLSLFPNFSFPKKTNPTFPLGKSSLIKRMSILFFPKLQEVAAALWSAIEQNDSRFSIIFISYFYEKDGGRWETYCLYGVEGDGILSIL